MQQNIDNSKPGVLPSFLLSSFALLYFSMLLPYNLIPLVIGGLIIFAGGLWLLSSSSLWITKSTLLLIVYFIFLASALLLSSIFAQDPAHSASRAVYSVGLFFILFFIYRKLIKVYLHNIKWRNYFSKALLFIMLIVLFGQLLNPDWRMGMGGVRLTGGTNPNFVSFFALFIIFISHFNSLLEKKWSRLNKVNWLLATVILFWSMSRGSILGFVVFYLFYFGWYFVKGYLEMFLRGKLSKKLFKNSILLAIVFGLGLFVLNIIKETDFYRFTILRFTSDDGLSTRGLAWEILLSHFNQNPLFGGVGWWNATNVLPDLPGIAQSPHSLYVRLLSEVGIVGTVAVLLLPVTLICILVIKSYGEKEVRTEKLMMLTSAILVGIFTTQITEDTFLVGIFSLSNLIIIFTIALAVALIERLKSISQDKNLDETTNNLN